MNLKYLLPLFALLVLVAVTAACSPSVRAVGRSLETGAVEAQREIVSMQKAGEIEEDTAMQYTAVLSEIESNGRGLSGMTNWSAMPRAEKRSIIVQQIGQLEASARRLDEAGVLGIKSATSRKRVEEYKRNIQRGLSVLRIVEASITAEQ